MLYTRFVAIRYIIKHTLSISLVAGLMIVLVVTDRGVATRGAWGAGLPSPLGKWGAAPQLLAGITI